MKSLFLLLLLPVLAVAQKQLTLTRISDGKTQIVSENRRIRVVDINGNAYKGRIHFIDDMHFRIKKDTIAVADIVKIKTLPLGISITGGFLTFTGTFILLTPTPVIGIPYIAGGILMITARSNHKKSRWKYEITGS